MARQWFTEGVQVFEDGEEEFFIEGAQINEDQAAAVGDVDHVAATAIEPLGLVTLPPSVTSY